MCYLKNKLCIKCILYNRTDVSEGIDDNKANKSKECDICHYWHFSNKFQTYVWNKWHDLLMSKTLAIFLF